MLKEIIDSRYRIIEEAGPNTYISENISTGVKWILKEMDRSKYSAANKLGFLRHPALPRLVENLEFNGSSYAVFEYISGKTLDEVCRERGGMIDHITACKYIRDISCALNFLHSNHPNPILHLDIKPSNIIIQEDDKACLIDFGSMYCADDCMISEETILATTVNYAPKELISRRNCSLQSDIYMLGTTLLRIIIGIDQKSSLENIDESLLDAIPLHLRMIINKCTMYLPEDRYGSAAELANDLSNVITEREYISESVKISPVNKGKVICIWGNPFFAAELAWNIAAAGYTSLLLDADLLSPKIDKLISIREEKNNSNRIVSTRSSLGQIMNEYTNGRLTQELIEQLSDDTDNKNLKCICGDYRMEDYDHYSTDGLISIIRTSVKQFDTVIVECSKFIYDEFTCISFISSDEIIIPIDSNRLAFREYAKYVDFLSARKQIDKKKIKYIGFEYRSEEDLSPGICQEICDGKHIGVISFSSKRRMLSGSSKVYVKHMEEKIKRQYRKVIEKLEIK